MKCLNCGDIKLPKKENIIPLGKSNNEIKNKIIFLVKPDFDEKSREKYKQKLLNVQGVQILCHKCCDNELISENEEERELLNSFSL